MSSFHNLHVDLNEALLQLDKGYLKAEGLGLFFTFGPTEPTAFMAEGALWLDSTNKLVKNNTGTLATPVWTTLAIGTTATIIADGTTLQDAGSLDCTLAFTQQTGSAPSITVPQLAGADVVWAFLNLAQTWSEVQTFKYGKFVLNDNNDTHGLTVNWEENDSAARALDIKVNGGDRILDLGGNLVLAGTWTHTGAHAVGITTGATTTLVLPAGGANFEVVAALNTSFAQGDILQLNAAGAWEILAVGANGETLTTNGTTVSWGSVTSANASNILNGATLQDTGALDCILAFTEQTVSAPTLTVPNYGGAAQTLATLNLVQTWLQAQTFKYGKFLINDNNDTHAMTINWEENDTGARALDLKVNGGDRIIDLSGNLVLGGTLTTLGAWTHVGAHTLQITTGGATTVTLPTSGTLATVGGALGAAGITGGTAIELTAFSLRDTNAAFDLIMATDDDTPISADRTLTWDLNNANRRIDIAGNIALSGTLTLLEAWTQTGAHTVGITTTGATTITFPTAGTLMSISSTDVLTNKTLDADAAGNVITNLNVDELDPATVDATTATSIPFLIHKAFTNLDDTGTDFYTDNAPFKMKILDAYAIATSANGGDWELNKGKNGALGNTITSAKTVAGTDNLLDRATSLVDAEYEIAANGSLAAVSDAGGTFDCIIVVTAIRSD